MGEFADYAVEQAIDAETDRWLYRQGWMSDEYAYDLGIINERGEYRHVPMFAPRSCKQKTCRACGQGGLHWGNVKGGAWRLFDGNTEHICGSKGANSLMRKLLNAA